MSHSRYPIPPPEKYLGLSTTSVGCGPGGGTPMIARVALVDYRGQVVFSAYILPTNPVTDYRTSSTGIRPEDLQPGSALPWRDVQQRVAQLIKDKIIVGHTLWQDLSVLGIRHAAVATRDVALYQPFRNALRSTNHVIGLPTLMWQLMRRRVQETHVCPLENARAALDLYRSHSDEWESTIAKGQWPSFLPPSTFSRCYQGLSLDGHASSLPTPQVDDVYDRVTPDSLLYGCVIGSCVLHAYTECPPLGRFCVHTPYNRRAIFF